MKIIKIKTDVYTLENLTWSGYQYKDLTNKTLWWPRDTKYWLDCFGSKEVVEAMYASLRLQTFWGQVYYFLTTRGRDGL